jgi:rRNA-processing protein EBP2
MAKKKNHHQSKQKRSSAEKDEERRLTLEAIEAMSDDSDDDDDQVGGELNTKAKNLRDAIASGKFDGILDKLNSAMNDEESGEEFEEDVLGASDDEEDAGDVEDSDSQKGENCDDGEEEEAEEMDNDEDEAHAKAKEFLARVDEASSDEEEDDDGDHSKNDVVASKAASRKESNDMNAKALAVAVTELRAEKAGMPWAETFAIIPSTPLPFGENGDPESNPLDIHDDLKREVAFYNSALEAIKDARVKCTAANIPFSRPEDFFAEMVKTDGMLKESMIRCCRF